MRRLIGWITPNRAAQQSQTDWWHRIKMVSLAALGLGLISTGGMLYVDRTRVISELHQLGAEVGLKLRHIQVRGSAFARNRGRTPCNDMRGNEQRGEK